MWEDIKVSEDLAVSIFRRQMEAAWPSETVSQPRMRFERQKRTQSNRVLFSLF
jgi:hypothetical protein